MDGGGGDSAWLAFFAGVVVVAAAIGWFAARASGLGVRRHTEDRELRELLDLHHDDLAP
ncbi:hypothetical protein [Cellulosimicrobium sp. NPDC057127]|uniref:hypothetical protein n=1 Tax=Cellulosimicrobium sp. NPDC057127 TaxID=3346026 RepID=UPI00363007A8